MADIIQLGVQLDDHSVLEKLTSLESVVSKISGKKVELSITAPNIERTTKRIAALNAELQTLNGLLSSTGVGSFSSTMEANAKTIKDAAEGMKDAAKSLGNATKAVNNASNGGGSGGSSGGSGFLGIAGSMLKYQAITFAINKTAEAFTFAFDEMKNVDTEMVNIAKVTRMSAGELEKLEKAAYSLGSQYGRTGSEVLEAQTVFARAGYTDQIVQLAELSLLLQNAGDLEADDAAKFIIATDAAYKLGGSYEELMKVIDGLDNITNKNATDMQKMTDGMTIAGSVFAESGESVQTFAALLGAGTALTQRSGSEIARGLRTILMNLRQIKGETEDGELIDGESIANAAKALKEYAGISTMENGKLRKASDVLEDLAAKWKDLDETQRSAISEAVAGKRQANVLMAIMGNWEMVGKMEEEYANAAGTAAMENAAYMESWAAKIEVVKASWTELVQNIVSSDLFKGFLTEIADILDRINNLIHPQAAADERVATLKQEYDALYGQDGEMQDLLSRESELTDVEKRRLKYLQDQQEARRREIREAQKAEFEAFQKEKGSGKAAGSKTITDANGDQWTAVMWQDEKDLLDVSAALKQINEQFAQTADINAYNNGITALSKKYATLKDELQGYRDAGMDLTPYQEQLLDALTVLDGVMMTAENDADAYTKSMAAYYLTQGQSAQEAANSAKDAAAQIGKVDEAVEELPESKEVEITVFTKLNGAASDFFNLTGDFFSTLFNGPHHAGGTPSAKGGPALVNELGPELISANGMAWIAGGGKPTITMLPKGATVLTANDTRRAFGGSVPAFEGGLAGAGLIDPQEAARKAIEAAQAKGKSTTDYYTETTDKDYSSLHGRNTAVSGKAVGLTGGGDAQYYLNALKAVKAAGLYKPGMTREEVLAVYASMLSSSGPSKPNFKAMEQDLSGVLKNLDLQAELAENQEDYLRAMEVYGDAQNEIAKLIEEYRAAGYADDSNEILTLANKGYSYANKQFKVYDTLRDRLIEALEALTEATEDANELAERREAVEKARETLANAQKQRNVRIFNPITGQWEWVANAEDIAKAEENLKIAEQALQKEEIDQTMKALENASGSDLSDLVLSPAILEKFANGTPEQQAAFISALNGATGGADYMASAEAQTAFNQGNTVNIGEQYNLAGITLTDQMANGMTIAQLLDYLQGLRIM